jgi:hypothetical protein
MVFAGDTMVYAVVKNWGRCPVLRAMNMDTHQTGSDMDLQNNAE